MLSSPFSSMGLLTEKLRRYLDGDREIEDTVFREILPRLRRIASSRLKRARNAELASTTELIHEFWIQKLRGGGWRIRDREHFYSISARAMRQVLVDLARRRLAKSRGGGQILLSSTDVPARAHPASVGPELMIELGMLMEQLEKEHPSVSRVVDLHYFAEFTLEETAEIAHLSLRQVRHRWNKGRDWLKDRLRD